MPPVYLTGGAGTHIDMIKKYIASLVMYSHSTFQDISFFLLLTTIVDATVLQYEYYEVFAQAPMFNH